MFIIVDNATKVIRGPYTSDETPTASETSRTITAQEFTGIDTIHQAGNEAVDTNGTLAGIQTATQDQAEIRKPFRTVILNRILQIATPANRVTPYQVAASVLLALDNKDKPGAKAIIDSSPFSAPIITQLKSLIDRISGF